ncbi:hypothetical protein [Natrinema sp. H-ect4]|uniref:hypothetical protein n=1 Tax=Natrinema sp. H-ect4 TaxID=3242699 RepID=UPI0035A85205
MTGEHYANRIIYGKIIEGETRRFVLNSCTVCGDIYHTRLDNLKNGSGKTCGLSCAGTLGARKRNQKHGLEGENNPNWKGGISQNHYRYKKRMQEKYPHKVAARKKVFEALRTGKLEKEPCEKCGSTENVEAHHEDYSRPLDVTWLCGSCHRDLHNN